MTGPEVSVVIPTRDRETRLAFALEGLARQTLPSERFEVIVVRAEERGRLATAPAGLRCRFLALPGSTGAGSQRNRGWHAAEGSLVAFMDDDCRPAPEWLERLLDAAQRRPGTIIQGRTEPDPDERRLLHGLARSISITCPSPWYETCNILYPRALLERLGGFDESFPGAWGEDTDLALRALELGASVAYAENALVWHAVNPRSPRRALGEALSRDALPALVAKHPQQRSALYLGLFARHAHGRLLLALAGAVALRRRPALALLATAPYASRYRHSGQGLRGQLRGFAQLPVRIPIDAAEVVALARASVRHRTLVL